MHVEMHFFRQAKREMHQNRPNNEIRNASTCQWKHCSMHFWNCLNASNSLGIHFLASRYCNWNAVFHVRLDPRMHCKQTEMTRNASSCVGTVVKMHFEILSYRCWMYPQHWWEWISASRYCNWNAVFLHPSGSRMHCKQAEMTDEMYPVVLELFVKMHFEIPWCSCWMHQCLVGTMPNAFGPRRDHHQNSFLHWNVSTSCLEWDEQMHVFKTEETYPLVSWNAETRQGLSLLALRLFLRIQSSWNHMTEVYNTTSAAFFNLSATFPCVHTRSWKRTWQWSSHSTLNRHLHNCFGHESGSWLNCSNYKLRFID